MALVLQLPVLSGLGPWKKADHTHIIYFSPGGSVNRWILSRSVSGWSYAVDGFTSTQIV